MPYFCVIYNKFQVKEIELKNNVPDFHWFQLQGIKTLAAIHEPNSKETIDGEEVLNEAISMLVQSYNEIYDNQVLLLFKIIIISVYLFCLFILFYFFN